MTKGKGPAGTKIDVWIGGKVRQRRVLCGLSQQKLASHLGVTFQQVQKFERGRNRIPVSRLVDIAEALDVPVSWFFEDLPEHAHEDSPARQHGAGPGTLRENVGVDLADRRDTLELIRNFHAIDDPNLQQRVYDFVRSLAKPSRIESASAE